MTWREEFSRDRLRQAAEYTKNSLPWVDDLGGLLTTLLLAPLLAIFLTLADVVSTWIEELIIRPARGFAGFLSDLIGTMFFGPFGRGPGAGIAALIGGQNPFTGLTIGIQTASAQTADFVEQFGGAAFPVALVFALLIAFVGGRAING